MRPGFSGYYAAGRWFRRDGDEKAFGASEDGAVGELEFGLMEELAALRVRWVPMRTRGWWSGAGRR